MSNILGGTGWQCFVCKAVMSSIMMFCINCCGENRNTENREKQPKLGENYLEYLELIKQRGIY